MERFVVTIARGYGSGGRTIGKMLAEKLGVNCYDREILKLASDDSGINEELFARSDEKLKGSLLYKVAKNVYKGELISYDNDNITNDNLFRYQAKVLRELAQKESYVVIGRCADYILKDINNIIRIFVHAPMERCIDVVEDMSSLSRQEIEQFILKTDKYRAEYYSHYTGKNWNDARNYDLCLNTGELSFEKCVEIVKNFMDVKFQ